MNNGRRDREPINGETFGYWAKVEARLERVSAACRDTQPSAGSNPAASHHLLNAAAESTQEVGYWEDASE